MIRSFNPSDLDAVMQIWLEANTEAHHFIPDSYWQDNFAMVSQLMPEAEVYVYDDPSTGNPAGFIGLTSDHIAGLFVTSVTRSQGIGSRLLLHVKSLRSRLSLNVYRKNPRAVDFYLREGFTISAIASDEATGEEEYTMIWDK